MNPVDSIALKFIDVNLRPTLRYLDLVPGARFMSSEALVVVRNSIPVLSSRFSTFDKKVTIDVIFHEIRLTYAFQTTKEFPRIFYERIITDLSSYVISEIISSQRSNSRSCRGW